MRLLYNLISPREQRGGHIEPKGLRGLQVDHQLWTGPYPARLEYRLPQGAQVKTPVEEPGYSVKIDCVSFSA